ncbi:peptidase M50 [Frankia sp. Cj3]|uniref:peptidase M50 n=1 Tax=Frankia sp. Cj3 TaxID=2880976 RepID=UPI001EF71902|nr:peptidase M50 [Frankia sp. Cj3]
MTVDQVATGTVRTPVSVRPGAAVSIGVLSFVLGAWTLPTTVPGRSSVAYLSAGLVGAGLLLALLLAADLARAAVARRAGVRVDGVTVGVFGSRLRAATVDSHEPRTGARVACVGLLVSGLGGAGFVTLGWLAPSGGLALAGSAGFWAGALALLMTLSELLPTPRTDGGRLLTAIVHRWTGSREQAGMAVARAGMITGWILIAAGAASVFVVGALGLWVALLGWPALASGRAERSRLRTNTILAGVRVGDVMGPAPEILPGWRTVSAAVEEMARTRMPAGGQTVFAVADVNGALTGVTQLCDLVAVPGEDHGSARVAKISVPLAAVPTTTPGELLSDLLPRLAERPDAGCALVLDDDEGEAGDGMSGDAALNAAARPRLIGTVGYPEIARALATVTPLPTGRAVAPASSTRTGRD